MQMDNQSKQPVIDPDKPWSLIKITKTNFKGKKTVKLIPNNAENLAYHKEHKRSLSLDKRELYEIEVIYLTLDEAVANGISEAIQTKFPPKNRKQMVQGQSGVSDAVVLQLIEQNQKQAQMIAEMAARLEAVEGKKPIPDIEEKPKTKK